MSRNHVATKLVCFGGNNVNVFQGTKFGVTKQIHNDYGPDSIVVHYILHNVKTRCISMLSVAKRMMIEYKTLLVKMVRDQNTNQQSKFNYEHFCDLQILLGLACIFPLLKSMHAHQVCPNVGHICIQPCGNHQSRSR